MRKALVLLLGLGGGLAAEEPSVSAIVSTLRYHPEGEPAAVGLRMLSRKDAPGWQALASLMLEFSDGEPAVARKAAVALAEGPEPLRLKIVAATYLQSNDDALRAILAVGLAYGYADHSALLLRHMREDRPGAVEVARILAPEILPEEELRKLLSVPSLARIVYDALLARGLTVIPEELVAWARAIALECLDPARCREWAAREPDFTILLAVANALGDNEEDVRDGAQCHLLTVSGRKLHGDADVWRSWIAGNRDRYERPKPTSPGECAAGVVRGARFLRRDLLDDGRVLWSQDGDGHHVIGSTALAVLALRAADCPATHPAIAKAVETTLLLFDKGGAPALRPIEHPGRETYVLSLLAMALTELDPARYKVPLDALKQRILSGQQEVGAWGYRCFAKTDKGDPGRWDNSCTQYAALALRALASKGFAVPPEAWQKLQGHLERGVNEHGRWGYTGGDAGNALSMTSAGIGSLAIALEATKGRDAAAAIRDHKGLQRGRAYLGRLLMEGAYGDAATYALYGVERACLLTATKEFRSKHRVLDWYEAGARLLLASQTADGALHGPAGDYGSALDTAYGILFLAKATRTIGGAEAGVVAVDLPPEKDVVEKVAPPSPAPPPTPEPPRLDLEWDRFPTREGEVVIVGVVQPADAVLLVDGKPVEPDARGRFFAPLTIARTGPVAVVARGKDGLETRREVEAAFDLEAPRVRLLGPPQRHVGKQILVFSSDEPLRCVSVSGHVYPADGRVVRAAVEVGEGKRMFSWTATDRAGNEGRGEMELEAENRFLSLDGGSALRIEPFEQPREFTIECWVRGDDPAKAGCLVSNAEHSGFGLYWASKHYNYPHGLVRCGGVFGAAGARRPWKWGSWTHLAFTYDGKAARFFVGGKLHAEVEMKDPYVVSRFPFWIGAEPDGNGNPVDFFRGSIDEVRFSRGARYAGEFRPERNFLRDDRTAVLLHFDLDTLADGVVLDDSGRCRHASFVGQPAIAADDRGLAPSGALAFVRDELRREMPPPASDAVAPAVREAEEQNARAEFQKNLGLVATTVHVQTRTGSPVPGIEVRALHLALDLSADPVTTDAQGDAVVQLPRGPWLLDLSAAPGPGRVVFARARFAVRDGARECVVLDRTRVIEFRTAKGELRTADSLTLSWPDFSFHRDVEALQGRLEIVTADDQPMLLQAARHPDDQGGYVFRRTLGPGRTVLETEPPDATTHVFKGAGARRLEVRYTSADALPLDYAFAGKETREILLAGMPEVVLHLGSEQGGSPFRYFPRPLALDGKRVEFEGAPKFEVSVGFIRNWRPQYKDVNSISLRFLLRTETGLLLSPDGPYSIAWEQVLDGKVRASGTAKPAEAVKTPPLDPKDVGKLRYRLQLKGPGIGRKLELEGVEQISAVEHGRVRTWCFPGLEANARAWVRCIDLAVRAYEETCPYRIAHLDVERSDFMPLPVIGMGGYGGDNGWMWLPGDTIYGFSGTSWWTGLLSHELGHVFRYGHSNPFENKIMVQAGRRAGRRLESIRPGMERVPEGNRYRALIEKASADEGDGPGEGGAPSDATGDGVLVPNLEITGDDSVFVWYYRSQFGEAAQAMRRKYGAAWSWLLTLKGFTDEEIRVAMLSRAAGTQLAWLVRMRGTDVRDARIAAALDLLAAAGENVPWQDQRDPVFRRWAWEPLGDDLGAAEVRMRGELGDRGARVRALLRIAREWIQRGNPAAGERTIAAAIVEARLGGEGVVDAALRDAAPLWLGR